MSRIGDGAVTRGSISTASAMVVANNESSRADSSTVGSASVTSTSVSTVEGEFTSFYDRWNQELTAIKDLLDEQLQSMVERSQHEMDLLSAAAAGVFAEKPKPALKAGVGPKVPAVSLPRPAVITTILSKHSRAFRSQQRERLLLTMPQQLSFSNSHFASSPSCRSQRTTKSDRTEPQSNLTKDTQERKRREDRHHAVVILPIQEEQESIPEKVAIGIVVVDGADVENAIKDGSVSMRQHFFPDGTNSDGEISQTHNVDETVSQTHKEDDTCQNTLKQDEIVPKNPIQDETAQQENVESSSISTSPAPTPRKSPLFRFFDTARERRRRTVPGLLDQRRDAPTGFIDKNPSSKFYRPDAPEVETISTALSTKTATTSPTATDLSSMTEVISVNNETFSVEPFPRMNPKTVLPIINVPTETATAHDESTHPSVSAQGSCTDSTSAVIQEEWEASSVRRKARASESYRKGMLGNTSGDDDLYHSNSSSISALPKHPDLVSFSGGNHGDGERNDSFSRKSQQDRERASAAIIMFQDEKKVDDALQMVSTEHVTNKRLTDPYGDEGLFSGVLIRGKPNSHGTMLYKDGRTYTGSWKRGRWDGHGKAIFANGDCYTGDYESDKRHGVGRYEWHDGRVYDGKFEHDQRQGNGIYSWPDGSVYSGEFRNGVRHGLGTFTFPDGSVFYGEWRNGKQHGNGECVWADGRCFRGEWVDGHTRIGVEVRADGTIRHDGEWRDDRPVRNKSSAQNKRSSSASPEKKLTSGRFRDLSLARPMEHVSPPEDVVSTAAKNKRSSTVSPEKRHSRGLSQIRPIKYLPSPEGFVNDISTLKKVQATKETYSKLTRSPVVQQQMKLCPPVSDVVCATALATRDFEDIKSHAARHLEHQSSTTSIQPNHPVDRNSTRSAFNVVDYTTAKSKEVPKVYSTHIARHPEGKLRVQQRIQHDPSVNGSAKAMENATFKSKYNCNFNHQLRGNSIIPESSGDSELAGAHTRHSKNRHSLISDQRDPFLCSAKSQLPSNNVLTAKTARSSRYAKRPIRRRFSIIDDSESSDDEESDSGIVNDSSCEFEQPELVQKLGKHRSAKRR